MQTEGRELGTALAAVRPTAGRDGLRRDGPGDGANESGAVTGDGDDGESDTPDGGSLL
jgi:hypothetical protein